MKDSLLDALTFYGSYHNNAGNKIVHLIFVPVLWATGAVFFCYAGTFTDVTLDSLGLPLPPLISQNFVFNYSFLLFLGYALYYLYLDLFAGLTADILLFSLLLGANAFYAHFGADAWKYALAAHLFSWFMQIYLGHGVLEGRKPALMDSLFQSLVTAPLFVWLEFLFFFGYDKKFQDKLQVKIDAAIAKWKQSKKN
eukprot:TRINITY_DN164_c0_g1_i6.p1 TRINITY_DN164_c0_g1~~TRINITY_DN164_c0_g1_i6.p1  ORF type:complete len:196 (-),score=83.71 TRINITY_DN164_c0_g1_i6:312-899(-)